ncbi:hypothetical protein J1605_001167 [Eschrichtius robustus]|uniref:STE20-related kinase adapter protein alpha n=1 Tax=Eschrichtius robustus TaxID=9764 RepID=A0AB34GGY7_ESCRO|nr:hypothetical protein J1605_001167 [Eschrichtius robustus]
MAMVHWDPVRRAGMFEEMRYNGKVYLSSLSSNLNMISHGQQQRVVHDFTKYNIKVLPWLSPEVLQQNLQGYDTKFDIYSVGITDCELANSHVPFKDMPATQMLLEKLNGIVPCLLYTSTIPAQELTMSISRSIKRRASEALPELLCPVTPITNFEGSQSQDRSGIFGLVTNLEELEVDKWKF